ncbi:MAG: hypothetical protein EWM45_04715 [Rhodopseudomonas palustris]|nr:MAG: hypothetical protein EWM45_04715 [Rhodopseudomonas palustris]
MMKSSNGQASADFLRDLGDAARRNPVSTALIGMGVLWLITGGRPVSTASHFAKRGYDHLPDAARDTMQQGASAAQQGAAALGQRVVEAAKSTEDMMMQASTSLRDTSSSTRDRLSRVSGEVSGAVTDMSARSSELFGVARDRLTHMMDEQPLLVGAIGAAIGAGIAASLPATRLEGAYFGEAADQFKAKAAAFAGHEIDRVQNAAEQALDATSDAARHAAGKASEAAADAARGRVRS